MSQYKLLLGILSVWRVTHLLNAEDGPGDMVIHLRRYAGTGFWGQVLDCFYCLSMWIAVPFALFLGQKVDEQILLWPALSAGAILLERMTESGGHEEMPLIFEETEEEYVLRQKEKSEEIPPKQPISPSFESGR